jgi:hypothetical protein
MAYVFLPRLWGSKCSDPASFEGEGLESLVNVQLPAVDINSPSEFGDPSRIRAAEQHTIICCRVRSKDLICLS